MRCPPEVRPHSIRSMHRSSVHDDTLARDSNAHEQRETANPSISNKSDPQSVKYDSSLVKALYRAFIKTFWTAGLLELIGGMPLYLSFHYDKIMLIEIHHLHQTP